MAKADILNSVISTVEANTRKPEQFLCIQSQAVLDLKYSTKLLYDFTKGQSKRVTDALPELITEDFDEEQIWQQLELQNEGELIHFLTSVSRVLAGANKDLPISSTKVLVAPVEKKNIVREADPEISKDESVSDEFSNDEAVGAETTKKILRNKKPSIVDDKFFKLQELDEYLTKEERKEIKKNDESDEESVDFFNDVSEDEEEDPEEAKLVKYADFFDNPNSEDERQDRRECNFKDNGELNDELSCSPSPRNQNYADENEESFPGKRVSFNLTNDSDETDSVENKTKEETVTKSALETRQERLRKKIEELERAAVSEKPWQLKGEVSAANRPQNSLLQEFVEFDVTTRPAPIITEQTTLKLEDIIKQRIKDEAWEDVEKKFKPVETPLEYKKKLVLDQEKSKESLSQIYEKEYLKQREALSDKNNEREVEEEEPKLHEEIKELMHTVFSKLDALSNFHYTPKPAKPEIKIINNIPAINMEEVAPVAATDANLLAPEEIKAKPRGDVIGKAERTITDMKRSRRKKKLRQRYRQQAVEKKEQLSKLKPGIEKKYKKENAAALMKKLSKDRNITRADETGQRATKSSTAFFNQLQDQVKIQIKTKAGAPKKKQKDSMSAVKLKL